jgi:poly(hydroxyalkanoate) depolymerase family esterase
MKWSKDLRALGRGIKLGTRIAKAVLTTPKPESRLVPPPTSHLLTFADFGDNPGNLRMLAHLPPTVANGAPLVVLLHGCGQNAAGFAVDSGWTALADHLHFPLILPSQAEANNAGRCFQWFHPADTARDAGEAGSIAAMTRAAIERFHSDPSRVFILGLSAGAAMAAAMLAAYPDLFAAGASVAGLPVGSAQSALQAMLRMASAGPDQSPDTWASQVRTAAPAGFTGPWPRLSIWQGQADTTVAPGNANLLATQWCALHGLSDQAMVEQERNGVRHRIWPDAKRRLVELWSIAELPHAYPSGNRRVAQGRFVEPAPVDATAAIADFFGLD